MNCDGKIVTEIGHWHEIYTVLTIRQVKQLTMFDSTMKDNC